MFLFRLVTIAGVLWLVEAVVFLSPVEGAVKKTTVKKASASKTPGKAQAAKKAPAAAYKAPAKSASSKPAVSARNTTKNGAAKKGYVKPVAAVQRQRTPSQDRYQEIQRVLAEKGYYQGSVNGAWGPESTDALKRFQRDQKISDDGKLSSKSIIALGLGPQRTAPVPGKEQ